jgi:hypothetical protein
MNPSNVPHTDSNLATGDADSLLIGYSFASFFNSLGFEVPVPRQANLDEKKKAYRFTTKGGYPPHLEAIPEREQTAQYVIFDKLGLAQVATLLPKIVPQKDANFLGTFATKVQKAGLSILQSLAQVGPAPTGSTIALVEENNRHGRKTGTDVMRGQNIGDYGDWFSDAKFAQQQFTGTNPTTITTASKFWLDAFKSAAQAQSLPDMVAAIEKGTLYVQDCSYFRAAFGVKPGAEIVAPDENGAGEPRYCCATVALFDLHDSGLLHPLGIVIDYKNTIQDSVVIFNKRLSPEDRNINEKADWPWRYAKTCAQVSDWIRHEVQIHLVNTHLVEEVIIVATHRCIPESHPIFFLLEPHWFRTLSLNAAARQTLVPSIIFDLVGLTGDQALNYTNYAFDHFDFTGLYLPKDLEARGFPPSQLDAGKFRNYAYARNMVLMWKTLHQWVESVLSLWYHDDQSVANDPYIAAWSKEIQSKDGGRMPSFPTIATKEELFNAVTMCIHIASPQHTAVNYLQNFYYAFVINKPPALYRPLPNSLADLKTYKEAHLVAALPIGRTREWLLAAHIPWLLSFKVGEENNLVNFAASVYNVYKKRTVDANDKAICQAAEDFYHKLRDLAVAFNGHFNDMEQGDNGITGGREKVPYHVMAPWSTAMSILI